MVKMRWKRTEGDEVVDLEALRHSRLPTFPFSPEALKSHGWRGWNLNPKCPVIIPRIPAQSQLEVVPGIDPAINVTQSAVCLPFPRLPNFFPDPAQVQTIMNVNVSETAFPQNLDQQHFTHDHNATEMNGHSSHGRQAMDILKEKLAHADTNEVHTSHIQDADMTSNAYALHAASHNDNFTTHSNGFVPSQAVHLNASFSEPLLSNGQGENSPTRQQQNGYCGTLLSRPNGDLTIVTSASAGDNVGRNLFSNDHLSSTIVPLEDPAEALALSHSNVPIEIRQQRSRQLNLLTSGPNQCPTAAAALHPDNFPFVEGARLIQAPPAYGVIRLRDIPEGTRRCDILAIMGRNAKVLNDNQEPVHIIIERVNAATLEAYVEFVDEKAAEDAIEKFQQAKKDGRAPRLGDYPVHYELSSQAALMKSLFPQAKGVQWISATPHIVPAHQVRFPWDLFKGFITVEEMNVLAKHAEVNKSWQCPQRPYECMISVLRKMPWYMTGQITMYQRQSMYDATVRLIRSLQKQIRFKNNVYLLNEQLLERLSVSAMLCHGFTVTMKDNIAFCVHLSAERMRDFNMPRFSELWVHTHTLVPKPGAPLDVLEWYIAVIREMTSREVERLQPNELRELRRQVGRTTLYWGYYWRVLRLDDLIGPAIDNMTLGEMARREFHVMTGILNQAFGGQQADHGQQQQQLLALLAPDQQVTFGEQQQVDDGQQSVLSGQ